MNLYVFFILGVNIKSGKVHAFFYFIWAHKYALGWQRVNETVCSFPGPHHFLLHELSRGLDSCNRKWHRPGNKANKSGLRATKLSSALDLSKLPSLNKNRRDITTNTEKTFNPNPKKQLGVQSMISDRYL